jgi:thiosulfate/3-mercaptopyruvate sulfurtransferase
VLDLQNNQNYLRFHIPGSVNTEYAQWRIEKNEKKGQPKIIPPTSVMEKLIESLGIDNDSHIVLISLGNSAGDIAAAATRVYWTSMVLEHDQASILDGGLVAYAQARKYPLEKGHLQSKATRFKAHYRNEMNPDAQTVRSAIESGTQACG